MKGVGADERLRRLERAAQAEVEGVAWYPGYSEPGYAAGKNGVLAANWNVLPTRAVDVLERAGYSVEWSDEWIDCCECGGAVRTQSDGYDWTPAYKLVGDAVVCHACQGDE